MRKVMASIAILLLLLLSSLPLPSPEGGSEQANAEGQGLRALFDGFHATTGEDVWNMTPWSDVAVPEGFDLLSVLDYSDVGVLINNNSAESRAIGWAFIEARNISSERIFVFNGSNVPTSETINRAAFETHFEGPFRTMLAERGSSSEINFLVTTKGIPLRVSGGNDKASFDQELALIGGSHNASLGQNWWSTHTYGPLAGKSMERFTRSEYGFFLVTRLTGYDVETAIDLIERANQSLGSRGSYVLDLATNRNNSGYKFWNDDLYDANATLINDHNATVLFDETSTFLTNVSDVLGYASWGSNDGSWSQNHLPDSGFEAADSTTSTGRRSWEQNATQAAATEVFGWSWDNGTKRGGQGSMALAVKADCNASSGRDAGGLLGEYFDNQAGVTIPSGAMPTLIDRVPDMVQVEPGLDHNPSSNAYPGLDDRFKTNWGARFSALIDVPWAGNWTFYVNSDDGTELWINGESVVQNHGMHGMVEISGSVNLTEGFHDLWLEFYQGGGPHGLKLSWSTSNLSKTIIPTSALKVAGDWLPSPSSLEHRWAFEDGSGSTANDSHGTANLTLYGMNASNWRTCVDGGCLWFDGVDDYADVDVDDWDGNLTVSQWVWANTSAQPDYASVFAVSNNAGANASFQHASFNGEWRLHNNQTHTFGSIEEQRWMHLVTVYDGGEVRQYFDGVLVNTHQQPAGAINAVERFRLGVNRAGSVHFEGMIDEVMVWSSALEHWEVTALHRTILSTCQPFSASGNGVANLSQTFTLDPDQQGHAWLGLGYGQRIGAAHGAFNLMIEGLDPQGQVLSTNTSTPRTLTEAWATGVFRFRPDANATQLRVTVLVDVTSSSVDGSIHIDDVLLRTIRPSMGWVPGSIAETAVSTGGRSFAWGTSYGQSLVVDLLEDGVSGVKGYVYEPYLTAVGRPSVLFDAYASGYGFAEANAMANLQIGWMGVVVGDPKMAPYADRLHDLAIVAARVDENVTSGTSFTMELVLENHGMSAASGSLVVTDVQGSDLLKQEAVNLSEGNLPGSRTLHQLELAINRSGWVDVQVRYVADEGHPEADTSDNVVVVRFWANAPPTVEDVRCLGDAANRGDSIVCEVDVNDDLGVVGVDLEWSVQPETGNATAWVSTTLGSSDGLTWWTTLAVPTDPQTTPVGSLNLRATAKDASNATGHGQANSVLNITDAPGRWFGPHVQGLDAAGWTGSTTLTGTPQKGLSRVSASEVSVCVDDVDYDATRETPWLEVRNRANEPMASVNVSVRTVASPEGSLHCHGWFVELVPGLPMDDLDLVVLVEESERLRRRFRIGDEAPSVSLSVENLNGSSLESVLANGQERLRVHLLDVDDPAAGAYGDLRLTWPGLSTVVLPLQIPAGSNQAFVDLLSPLSALEDGQLRLEVSLTGAHAATAEATLEIPLRLNGPQVSNAVLCDVNGIAEELRFGQEVWLGASLQSTRPMAEVTAAIEQGGWKSVAPAWRPEDTSAQPNSACASSVPEDGAVWFRLRPDGAFVNGEAGVSLRATDLDGRWSRTVLSLNLRHAPPVLGEPVINATGLAGDPVVLEVPVEDLDGLLEVTCRLLVRGPEGDVVHDDVARLLAESEQRGEVRATWLVGSNANGTHVQELSCVDLDGGSSSLQSNITLVPPLGTTDGQGGGDENEAPEGANVSPMVVVAALLPFAAVLALLSMWQLRRQRRDEVDEGPSFDERLVDSLWEASGLEGSPSPVESSPQLARPDGWTAAQYQAWLEGPIPEGWGDEQWRAFIEEQGPLNVLD